MQFIADLHIHSRYSISTSPLLIPEYLDAWARIKGITVVGTGDFTHPAWLGELRRKLEPAEEGLFRLKREFRLDAAESGLPLSGLGRGDRPVRFMLSAEISNIYRRGERVRKVHNLIFVPNFQAAETIQSRLSRIGNISSDGRPILGLDSRDLLEIALEVSDQSFFIPAHIWTPWFSALGAKSGFDSIAECYRDLGAHIRCVETGLSSDPPMNWLCGFLDRYTLISNSDAHSPEKLGREANLLDTDLSYPAIVSALASGQDPDSDSAFRGTLEFFPQEGKYHYDGHRKCGVCWDPLETLRHKGICSQCGRPVTIGVLNRVVQLSDREQPPDAARRRCFHSLVPLKELFAEITGIGPQSKQVARLYERAVESAGSELALLLDIPEEQIERHGNEVLAEAIRRMRCRQVQVEEGFDGQFGRVRVFGAGEIQQLKPQALLFPSSPAIHSVPRQAIPEHGLSFDLTAYRRAIRTESRPSSSPSVPPSPPGPTRPVDSSLSELNPRQREAVIHQGGPLLIIAGPGTGKTRTLTARIGYLIHSRGIDPANILAVTFTNKAAEEMRTRLQGLLSSTQVEQLHLGTFHRLGLNLLKTQAQHIGRNDGFSLIDEHEQLEIIRRLPGTDKRSAAAIQRRISDIKRTFSDHSQIKDARLQELFVLYEDHLRHENLLDLDDLICKSVELLRDSAVLLAEYRLRFRWILVDEYQDINTAQYRLIRLLAAADRPELFVIGDPNQAIYGFRGADVAFIRRFISDYPEAKLLDLTRSYRCSDTILQASHQMLGETSRSTALQGLEAGVRLRILDNPTGRSEAEAIARTIEAMMGGLRFFSMDSSISQGSSAEGIRSLSDFAVLCRIRGQMGVVQEAFANHAIPCQVIGETPFYRQEPVKSVIDMLRLCRREDPILRKAVLERKTIDADALDQLRQSAGILVSVNSMIRAALDRSGLEVPLQQIQALDALAEPYGSDLNAFLEYVVLGTAADAYDRRAEKVVLMTLHAAKGLEFPCVFIPGCEQGLLPYGLFADTKSDPEEERRLLYVGMTRAATYLFLSYAARRSLFGRKYRLVRSPFLDPIEQSLLELQSAGRRSPKSAAVAGQAVAGQTVAGQKQLDLF